MQEIANHSGSRVYAIFDNQPATAVATGIKPGEGTGIDPHFRNIGKSRGAVYSTENSDWYLIGRFKVQYYRNGEWFEYGTFENTKFTYEPPP